MKTLVVFLTIWSTCFSKPSTLQDQSLIFDPTEKHQDFIGSNLQDEKTAVLDNTHGEHPGTQLSEQNLSESPQERSIFVSKKPVLIKKGYHIYRSADEEQALIDPEQKCNKQVKVNICEEDRETSSNKMRFDSTFLRSRDNMTKDEMKKTIKMVKEVVEHMQKDLQTLEVTSTDLLTEEQLQSGKTKAQLHDDFVMLHTILDDLGKHIGDSSQSAKSGSDKKESKNTSKEHIEESRMMQWKETLKTIQEDSGTNIEDRFGTEMNNNDEKIVKAVNEEIEKDHLQSSSHDTAIDSADEISPHTQTSETMIKNDEDAEISITQDINGKETLHSDSLKLEQSLSSAPPARERELSSKTTDLLTETDHHTLQNSDLKSTHEMMISTKPENNMMLRVDTIDNLQEHMQDKQTFTNMVKRKSDEMEQISRSDQIDEHLSDSNQMSHKNDIEFKSQDDSQASDSTMKADHSESKNIMGQTPQAHFAKQTSNEMDADTPQQLKSSHNTGTLLESSSSIIPPSRDATPSVEIQSEPNNQFHSEMNDENTGVSHHLSESLSTRLAVDQNNQVLKKMSSDEAQTQHDVSQTSFDDHSQSITSRKTNNNAGKMDEALQHQFNGKQNTRWAQIRGMDTSMSDAHKMDNKNQEEKSGVHSHDVMAIKTNHHQHIGHQGDHMHRLHESSKHEHSGRMPFTTSDLNFQLRNGETHFLHNHDSELSNRHFAHDFYTMPAMRANVGFGDNSKMNMQSQHNLNIPHPHHFSSGMTHGQAMFHNEKLTESDDSMVQASEHIGMREAMLRSAGEYPQQYYNSQGNNKGLSYQEQPSMSPVVSSGSGAVGLFPNANVGGCGIPLLLSCSPNVVSGTLAKGQPSHSAPSYRSMDAYRYHKKRETKHSNSKLDIKTVPKIMFKGKVEKDANVIN